MYDKATGFKVAGFAGAQSLPRNQSSRGVRSRGLIPFPFRSGESRVRPLPAGGPPRRRRLSLSRQHDHGDEDLTPKGSAKRSEGSTTAAGEG